jgi:hypothetical protein
MTEELHEEFIRLIQEYIRYYDRFAYGKKSDEAGKFARVTLSEIRRVATKQRKAIMETRFERRRIKNDKAEKGN